jgi:hypothetical protein
MSLNPLRAGLSRSGLAAARQSTPFQQQAESALAGLRAVRADLEAQVRRGDLTTKVARQRMAAAAEALRADLLARSESFSPAPRVFVDRLKEISEERRAARETMSVESLQRETNRLLRQTLIEQQLVNRLAEFEGRAYVRPMGGGAPAPTLDGLLAFHEEAARGGDDAAQEWARRQLESFRSRATDAAEQQRIDAACDRPERVNPRIVARYVEGLGGADASALEEFAAQALASGDANACCAAFVLARESSEGMAARWVRSVLDGLVRFPDAALSTLRAWEADARGRDHEAARAQAEYTIALAETEARALRDTTPSPDDLRRQARVEARPLAAPNEPIGLNLARRGLTPQEYAQSQDGSSPDAPRDDQVTPFDAGLDEAV